MRLYLIAVAVLLCIPGTSDAQISATVIQDAPIFSRAEVMQDPMRIAAQGTRLRVVEDLGEWIRVEFRDPEFGTRVGFVERRHVRLGSQSLAPMDLSVEDVAGPRPMPRRVQRSTLAPRFETAIGWSFLHYSDPVFEFADLSTPLGWVFASTGNVNDWLGITVDVSGHYKNNVYEDLTGLEGVRAMTHSFLGGPRFALRGPVAVPYGYFLAGVTRTDVDLPENIPGAGSWDFSFQPGGGVDVGSGPVAVRAEVGWRRVQYEAGGSTQFRLLVGVVVRSGS